MPTEKERLLKEFEYLSNLIAKHKLLQVTNHSVSCKDAGVECITSSSTSTKQAHHNYVEDSSNNSAQICMETSLSCLRNKSKETYSENVSRQSFAVSSGNSTFAAVRSRGRRKHGSTLIPTTNPAEGKSLIDRPAANSLTGRSDSSHSKQGKIHPKNPITKFIVHLSDLPSTHETSELLVKTSAAANSNTGYCQKQSEERIENNTAGASLPSGLFDAAINKSSGSSTLETPAVGNTSLNQSGISTRQPSKPLSSASEKKVISLPLSTTLYPKVDAENECFAHESKKILQSRTVLLPRGEILVSADAASKPHFTCVLPKGLKHCSSLLESHCTKSVNSKWNKQSGSVMTNAQVVRSNERVKQSTASQITDPFFEKVSYEGIDTSCRATGLQITVEADILKQNDEADKMVSNFQWRSAGNIAKVAGQGKREMLQNPVTQNVSGKATNSDLVGINNNRYKLVRRRNCDDQPRQVSATLTERSASLASPGTGYKPESKKNATPVNKYRLVRPQNKVRQAVSNSATIHRCSQALKQPSDFESFAMLAPEITAGSIRGAPRAMSSKYKLVKQAKDQCTELSGISLIESSSVNSKNSVVLSSQGCVSTADWDKTGVHSQANLLVSHSGSANRPRFSSSGNGRQKVKYNNHSATVMNKYKLDKNCQPVVKQHVWPTELSTVHTVSHIERGKLGRVTAKPLQSRYKLSRRLSSGSSSVAHSKRKSGSRLNSVKQEDKVATSGVSVIRSKYKLVRRKSMGNRQVGLPGTSKSLLTSHTTRRRSTSLLVVNKYKLIKRRPSKDLSRTYAHMSTWKSPLTSKLRDNPHWNSLPWLTFNRKEGVPGKQICRKGSFVSKFALKRSTKGFYGDAYKVVRRRFNNVSRNKYKYINSDAALKHSKIMSSKRRFPQKSQLKVDRRRSSFRRRRSGSNALVYTKRFSLRRLPGKGISGGSIVENCSPLVTVATQIVQRSVYKLVASQANRYRKAVIDSRRYCMYYNRFGRCTRADKCTFIHDPDKVSVCTRYLRGTCKVDDCPFSHSVAPHKMPACQYFLRGICSRDKCPYLHVKVADNAEPCLDFARGYCRQGDMCKKLHVLVCPNFKTSGTCSRGRKCPMRHLKQSLKQVAKQTRTRSGSADDTESIKTNADAQFGSKAQHGKFEVSKRKPPVVDVDDDDDDPTLPMKQRRMPSYIALNSSTDAYEENNEQKNKSKDEGLNAEPLVIRPRLDKPAVDIDLSWMLNL